MASRVLTLVSDVIFVGLGGVGDVYWAFILFLFTLFIILFISCFPYYKLVSGARGISRAALCGGGMVSYWIGWSKRGLAASGLIEGSRKLAETKK